MDGVMNAFHYILNPPPPPNHHHHRISVKYVISSIPNYFENKETPIICYKYNTSIRSTVLNYNKLVTELDIGTTIPDSWDCKDC